jgi:hypothetical protein
MSVPDRRALLDHDHEQISVRRQCRLLGIARSGVYRERRPANDNDLGLMRRIDEIFTSWPFLGSRRLARILREEGTSDQPQARAAADAADGDRPPWDPSPARPSRRRATKCTPICCAA